jgi:hypothetical protein
MATMVARPDVNHVPTMTGGVDHDQLKCFHKYHFIGGNPDDAALKPIRRTGCAAGIALAVLHPDEVNVAGVAPIMIRTGSQGEKAGKVVTIAGLGHWPARFPADLFMREHGGKMPLGLLRTVVPAAPDAWITALCDYGTMSLGDAGGLTTSPGASSRTDADIDCPGAMFRKEHPVCAQGCAQYRRRSLQ